MHKLNGGVYGEAGHPVTPSKYMGLGSNANCGIEATVKRLEDCAAEQL